MVTDHTKANDQLKEVAMKEGIQLPTKLSAQDEMTKQRLSKLSGEQFDKAYMSDMVKDHTKDVADFQRESTSGQDPAVKDFASETLPTLQSHLQEAQQIDPATSTASR
jgi:putative membrane protein